jgi:L-threonylcarbamoyladenylate synthase
MSRGGTPSGGLPSSSDPVDGSSDLEAVASALRAGAVVAIPTDTVYGLAVDPRCQGASDLVFALKDRPTRLDLPVLVGEVAQAEALAGPDGLPVVARRLVDRFWPGSLTVVVARRPGIDWELGGDGATIGLRLPAHALVQRLCQRVGPLATTSANRHGRAPITTAAALVEEFGGGVAVVVDGGICDGAPSTVVDVTGAALRCIREGAVAWRDIEAAAH